MSKFKIPLTKGKFALVSECDYKHLKSMKWYVLVRKNDGYCSVKRAFNGKIIKMANYLLNPPKGYIVDHINGDPLDNRRENLRIATNKQNCLNKRKYIKKNLTSIYKGVSYRTLGRQKNKRWWAGIIKDKKRYSLGYYATEIEAAKAYDLKAIELHGEYARLNFDRKNYDKYKRNR